MTVGEWVASTVLSDREKRCVTLAWARREEKVARQLSLRKSYLGQQVSELEARVQTCAAYIFRLRKALFLGDITELLQPDDEDVVSEGEGGGTEVGGHPTGDSALPPETSATQRNRLVNQEYHRDTTSTPVRVQSIMIATNGNNSSFGASFDHLGRLLIRTYSTHRSGASFTYLSMRYRRELETSASIHARCRGRPLPPSISQNGGSEKL